MLAICVMITVVRRTIVIVAAGALVIIPAILVSLGSLAANFVVSATLIGVAIIAFVVQEPLSLPHKVIVIGSRSRCSDRRKRNRHQERGS
jgi:hypothetical protein